MLTFVSAYKKAPQDLSRDVLNTAHIIAISPLAEDQNYHAGCLVTLSDGSSFRVRHTFEALCQKLGAPPVE
jgi:hypothetical protein